MMTEKSREITLPMQSYRRSMLILWLVILACLHAIMTWAGGVSIVVSDEKLKSCLRPSDPEQTQYLLTAGQTIAALEAYFNEIPNRDLIDAAIVNAGIKFCSDKERVAVLSAIVHSFDQPKIKHRALEVATNYYPSKVMKRLIEEAIESKNSSRQLKVNLLELKSFAKQGWSKK